MSERSFTVVGGGVAGLVAARDLALAGHRVSLLEASDRFGGQLAAIEVAGVAVDAGAESFATRGGAVLALLTELGVADDVAVPAAGAAWVRSAAGRSYPLPAAAVLGIPAHPLARDVVRAVGLPAALRACLDAVLPATRDAGAVGDLVTARMGRRITRDLVAPVVRGVYSAEPEDLAVATAAPALAQALRTRRRLAVAARSVRSSAPAGSQVAGLRGGMVRLVDLLVADAERLGVELRTGAVVADLANHTGLAKPPGDVVVAAPGLASPVAQQRSVTVVVAAVRGLAGSPRGSGVLVAPGSTGVTARALTHSSAKWSWWREDTALPADLALVRLSYDGVASPSDAVLTSDLRALTGSDGVEVVARATRAWERTIAVGPIAAGPTCAVLVGEASGRTGLAAIVAHTRTAVAKLLTRPAPTLTPALTPEPTGGPS